MHIADAMEGALNFGGSEEAGVPSYWMFDPQQARLTVLELQDEKYVERAVVSGDQMFEAEIPFAVTVVPGGLSRSGG